MRSKLPVLTVVVALVFAASFLAACGGGDTEQGQGNKSGSDSSDKQGGGTSTSTKQQIPGIFSQLPKQEPGKPGENLRTRLVSDSQQGGGTRAQIGPTVIFPGGAGGAPYPAATTPPTSVPAQMDLREYVQLVANNLDAYWTNGYLKVQKEGVPAATYTPPVLQIAVAPVLLTAFLRSVTIRDAQLEAAGSYGKGQLVWVPLKKACGQTDERYTKQGLRIDCR